MTVAALGSVDLPTRTALLSLASQVEAIFDGKGLILTDSAKHRWRITVSTSGVLTTTDLGV